MPSANTKISDTLGAKLGATICKKRDWIGTNWRKFLLGRRKLGTQNTIVPSPILSPIFIYFHHS